MLILLLCSFLFVISSSISLDKKHDDLPVCIIGAGMAGLAAAGELQKSKINYIVIEGANRVGGRVYPVKYGDGFLQYGATYIHGDNNPIFDFGTKLGVLDMNTTNVAFDDYVPIYTEKEVIQGCDVREFTAFTESFTNLYREYAKNGKAQESFMNEFNRDYHDFLEAKNRQSRKSHFDLLARMYVTDMETEYGAHMKKYALLNYEQLQYGHTEYTLNNQGYYKILNAIKGSVDTSKIQLKSEVTNIDYSNGKTVTLTTSRPFIKRKIQCSSVIVTVSLGYLKKHSQTLFTPQLPQQKKAAIKELGFDYMQKLFFIYEKAWLDKHSYHTMASSNSSIFYRGLTFDVTPWSREAVQFWFSGPTVAAIGEMSDEKLIDEVTNHLRKTLKNVTVPKPVKVIRHMWYKDPLILGSYSYLTSSSVALKDPMGKLAEPIMGKTGKPLVQFAGEATHSTIYQTTIGAYLSGQREAKRLTKK